MADNVAITAGAGTTIATDDVGAGVQVQRVKVTWGVDGTATDATETTPLPVVSAMPQYWFELDVPGASTTAYAIGDQVGTLISITNAARGTGEGGWINGIVYHDNDDVMGALDFVFFNDTVSLAADSTAFAISDADARKVVYIGSMTYLTDLGAQRFGQLQGMSVPYFCTGTTLYCAIIARAAATLAAGTSQRVRFALTRD